MEPSVDPSQRMRNIVDRSINVADMTVFFCGRQSALRFYLRRTYCCRRSYRRRIVMMQWDVAAERVCGGWYLAFIASRLLEKGKRRGRRLGAVVFLR